MEQFTDDWSERWTVSEATKKTPVGTETFSYVGKWEVEEPKKSFIAGDKGLVAKTKAAHHAISAPFVKPISFTDKPLVVQYEVKYQEGGNSHALNHDSKTHEKANAPPHRAEIAFRILAIGVARKFGACQGVGIRGGGEGI